MSLQKFRKDIEKINSQILRILAKRNNISKKVGKYKKKYGMKIVDKNKEKNIYEDINQKAEKLGLNPRFAKDVFKIVIKESKRLQK